jgi:DNA-binding NarL/FixJ family response regulator
VVRFGNTVAVFRFPDEARQQGTSLAKDTMVRVELSPTQRRVLLALCQPFREGRGYATPATNQQIGDAMFLSVDAVKGHLRVLFTKFGVGDLPQNRKRAALVEQAFASGTVTERDFDG